MSICNKKMPPPPCHGGCPKKLIQLPDVPSLSLCGTPLQIQPVSHHVVPAVSIPHQPFQNVENQKPLISSTWAAPPPARSLITQPSMKVLKNRPTKAARDTIALACRLQPPIRSSTAELLGGDLRTRYNCSEPVPSPGASTRWLDQGGERAAQRHMRMCVFLRLEQAESPVSAILSVDGAGVGGLGRMLLWACTQ